MFRSKTSSSQRKYSTTHPDDIPPVEGEVVPPPHQSTEKVHHNQARNYLPGYSPHHKKTKGINHEGESGRKGIHPLHFLWICFRSSSKMAMTVNILWPVVPAAIAVHFALPEHHLLIFILNYIAMVPAATLIGFAGQELARKMPKVLGVLMETTLGSITEVVLFIVLVAKKLPISVVRAAILGSILANLLLCLGLCFLAGGLRRQEQVFHEAISDVGSNLLLVAGFGLIIPTAFASVLSNNQLDSSPTLKAFLEPLIIDISRATAIILLIAYVIYIYFQVSSHHGIYAEVLEADEQRDNDRHKDLTKSKLTLIECILALSIAVACVALIAVFLVLEIEYIVEDRGISDAFMGLILVPLVEKAAEHLTAVDEAWDDQANFALTHVLGASIQTALLNTPLVIMVGWGIAHDVDLNFKPFEAIVLILAILVVGGFLRDGKSNYLEGALCVLVYVIVAVSAFYYPNEAMLAEAVAGQNPSNGGAGAVERRAIKWGRA
ncbi:MAG: hypothetical protein M1828_005995 [Chrysothrix sp. TS-e1954]|nr:MAG: hypothetical protein M1828_005995 [Chrysothrix sp. TS-e1954]